jgi:hypothetical protein
MGSVEAHLPIFEAFFGFVSCMELFGDDLIFLIS